MAFVEKFANESHDSESIFLLYPYPFSLVVKQARTRLYLNNGAIHKSFLDLSGGVKLEIPALVAQWFSPNFKILDL